MDAKREAARLATEREQMEAEQAQANAERERIETERERLLDVIAALRSLGYRAEQARHIAERSNAPGLDLEQHVRAALRLAYAGRAIHRDAAPNAA